MVLSYHHSLNKKVYLAGSLFVTCLIIGFLSANIAYYSKLVQTERPVQVLVRDQELYTIIFLVFNSLVLFASLMYTWFRVTSYQSDNNVTDYKNYYIVMRITELIMVIFNVITLYGFMESPNSFVMPGNQAQQMFWYGITIIILLCIEVLWNFGVIRGGLTTEEEEYLKKLRNSPFGLIKTDDPDFNKKYSEWWSSLPLDKKNKIIETRENINNFINNNKERYSINKNGDIVIDDKNITEKERENGKKLENELKKIESMLPDNLHDGYLESIKYDIKNFKKS